MDPNRKNSYLFNPDKSALRPEHQKRQFSYRDGKKYSIPHLYLYSRMEENGKFGIHHQFPTYNQERQHKNSLKLSAQDNENIKASFRDESAAEKQILNQTKKKNRKKKDINVPEKYKKQLMDINSNPLIVDNQRSTTFGLIRQNTSRQLHQFEQNEYKRSTIDELKTSRNHDEGINAQDFGLKYQNAGQKYKGNPLLSEDAIEIIAEIQRKAIQEIDALRQDKVSLMRKLNCEIKDHNKEKKLRFQLQKEVKRLRDLLSNKTFHKDEQKQEKILILQTNKQKNSKNPKLHPVNQNINIKNSPPFTKPIHFYHNNNNLLNKIHTTQNSNNEIKNNSPDLYANNHQLTNFQYKQRLLAECNYLKAYIRQFQVQIQMLQNQNNSNPQIEQLLQQGEQLRRTAARIMSSENEGMTRQERSRYFMQIDDYRKRINILQEQNKQLRNNKEIGVFGDQKFSLRENNRKGEPRNKISEYENMLDQLRKLNRMR